MKCLYARHALEAQNTNETTTFLSALGFHTHPSSPAAAALSRVRVRHRVHVDAEAGHQDGLGGAGRAQPAARTGLDGLAPERALLRGPRRQGEEGVCQGFRSGAGACFVLFGGVRVFCFVFLFFGIGLPLWLLILLGGVTSRRGCSSKR